jgi:hypothetical protein
MHIWESFRKLEQDGIQAVTEYSKCITTVQHSLPDETREADLANVEHIEVCWLKAERTMHEHCVLRDKSSAPGGTGQQLSHSLCILAVHD